MPIVEFKDVSRVYESGDHVLRALASEYEMMAVVSPLTYVISIVLTLGMSLLVSLLVARKNRRIDMVESLKGAE